jgi:hypothetical protein
MKLSDIPDEVIEEYKLREKATKNGSIYIRFKRGMYGLPQSELLANELLEKHLNKLTCDWTGTQYIGITLDWDYNKRQVHLSMPNYVKKALKQFQTITGKLQHSPYPSVPIQYGAKKQYTTQELTAPLLDDKAKHFIQQVCGKFLFLGRAVDSTLLCPISAIASQLSKPTTVTMQQTLQLLDYLATQEDAVLSYHASDMILAAHSNASYLSEPNARSRAGGHFFLSSDTTVPPSIKHCAHHQERHVISHRSRTRGTLHHGARSSIHQNHP